MLVENDRRFIDHILRPKIQDLMEMIQKNIFRPLPNKKATDLDVTEGNAEIEEIKDKSWPTFEVIYEILIQIIKHPAISESILKYFLTGDFIQNLLDLFESENVQERDYLKQITHKLYAKVVKRRRAFRKMFNNHFLTLIYEKPTANGANEILDIYAAIISGFAIPLRPEHTDFFQNFLTPLLKLQNCSNFYEELLRCILIFLNKDKTLAESLLKMILDVWPYGNTNKELAFLVTLYESLDFVSELENIGEFIEPFFKRVATCLNSEHVQVIDRCLCLFERDSLIGMCREYAKVVYPILAPPIERQIMEHWHETLKTNFKDLRSILVEIDVELYEEISQSYKSKIEAKVQKRKDLDSKWKLLEERIKESKPDFEAPVLPFRSDALVSNFNELYSSVGQKDKNLSN